MEFVVCRRKKERKVGAYDKCSSVTVAAVDIAVPTAPRDLRVSLTQLDPPIALLTWTRPVQTHGPLGGYKLTYGVTGRSYVEERRLDADRTRFTTGFLGQQVATLTVTVGRMAAVSTTSRRFARMHTKLDCLFSCWPQSVR